MPGFTRLENDTDLVQLLALPVGLVKPYLFLLSRANLNTPGLAWEEVAAACGLRRAQVFDVLANLRFRGLAVQKTGLWQSNKPDSTVQKTGLESPINRTEKKRRVQKTGLNRPINRTESSNKPDSTVQKTGLEAHENTVQYNVDGTPKEVEQKRTEVEQKKTIREAQKNTTTEIPNDLLEITGFLEAWNTWLEHLRAKKKPPTPQAIKLQFQTLQKSPDPVALLEHSTRQNWQGLYEPKPDQRKSIVPNATKLNETEYWAKARRDEDARLRAMGIDPDGGSNHA